MAVLSVGPLIAFGFLLIPALTARLFAHNMRQFTALASLVGARWRSLVSGLHINWICPSARPMPTPRRGLAVVWVIARFLRGGSQRTSQDLG